LDITKVYADLQAPFSYHLDLVQRGDTSDFHPPLRKSHPPYLKKQVAIQILTLRRKSGDVRFKPHLLLSKARLAAESSTHLSFMNLCCISSDSSSTNPARLLVCMSEV